MISLAYKHEQRDFVFILYVDSPIILTVPHDGLKRNDFDGIFKLRDKTAVSGMDLRAWHVARNINVPPIASMVRGLMPRPIIDYNRAKIDQKGNAFEALNVVESYDFYHRSIGRLVKRAKQEFGKCLVLDIHGFETQPSFGEFDIILGTDHRKTCATDVDIRFAEFLDKAGYSVYLPSEQPRDGEILMGHFTVQTHADKNVDAIQVEFGEKFRDEKDVETRQQLAKTIRQFLVSYFYH